MWMSFRKCLPMCCHTEHMHSEQKETRKEGKKIEEYKRFYSKCACRLNRKYIN